MDETDPFGREKSEDPLADMGWSTASGSSTESTPTEVAAPETPDHAVQRSSTTTTPPPRTPPRTTGPSRTTPYKSTLSGGIPGQGRRARNRGIGCLFGLIMLGVVAAIAVNVVNAIKDAVDDVDDSFPKITVQTNPNGTPGGGPGGKRDKGGKSERAPTALEANSLLRRGNLAPALRRLQRVTKSTRVKLIRIDPQKVIVTTASGGGTKFAQATWEGQATVLSSSPATPGSTFAWSQIDPSAPNRIARATTRGRRPSAFDYVVLLDAAGLQWHAFLKGGGGTYSASLDGRSVSKVG